MGSGGAVAFGLPLIFKIIVMRKIILFENVFNVKTNVIENPVTGNPLIIYN